MKRPKELWLLFVQYGPEDEPPVVTAWADKADAQAWIDWARKCPWIPVPEGPYKYVFEEGK